ncbi:Lrp/AsnC family transcriptional regulator [Paenibacillus filicis]|uniref:Lrp/AsnC family transcriptional regulator n=1 Tax=Paenibacillus filicis TaxID=669464 RepID=A0ABU9DNA3_9BACL
MQNETPSVDIDDIDRKIIHELTTNGRISYTDLGKEIGLSRVAVQARIHTLMDSGVIEQFTAVLNPAKVGIGVTAIFNIEVEPLQMQEVASKLSAQPAVTNLYHTTGPSKLYMHGLFATNQEMEAFLREKLYTLPGITSVDCQVLITRYKSRVGLPL